MLHHKIATSKTTLPATILYGIVALLAMGAVQEHWWLQSALLALATLLMVQLNNNFSLIRIYSRMVSCTFLVLSIATAFLLPSVEGGIEAVLFIISLLLLFSCYQDKSNPRLMFYSFVCLGLISTRCIHALLLALPLLLSTFTSLQAGSPRNLTAAILGLLAPYWVWLAVGIWTDGGESLFAHLATLAYFTPIAAGLFELPVFVTVVFLGITGIYGCIFYFNHAFDDNIKTRMYYHALMTLFAFSLAAVVLQPCHCDLLLRVLVISISPLVAQMVVFTFSRTSAVVFFVSCAATIALTVFNAWIGL